MITLYQFPRIWGLPNISPFCMKLENYLRMTALDYENHFVADPRKSPRGKLPFIKMDGQNFSDSELIIETLKAKFGDMLDKDLTEEQRALSILIDNTFSERLYFFLVYTRWQDEQGWKAIKDTFFGHLPWFAKKFVPNLIRKRVLSQLYQQGTGRHNRAEIIEMAYRSLDAILHFLGDKKYFMGNELTTVDATAFAFFANMLWFPFPNPFTDWAKKSPTVVAYCERMFSLLYPEMPKPC